jgi:transposase-like protein
MSSKRWSREEAQRILSEQRRSGKSVAAFAKERGLVPERLYWWQGRPKREAARSGRKRQSLGRAMKFAEVSPAPAIRPSGGEDAEGRLEVVLTSGRRILVPRGFLADDMQRLMAVLEAATC